jgi:hypothetical protein
MPQRPTTLADRLRIAWRRTDDGVLTSAGITTERKSGHRGSDFADRLRAAVTSRH